MADEQQQRDQTRQPEIVTELRAVEWELSEVIRRLHVLCDHVRDLQEEQALHRSGEESHGTL